MDKKINKLWKQQDCKNMYACNAQRGMSVHDVGGSTHLKIYRQLRCSLLAASSCG